MEKNVSLVKYFDNFAHNLSAYAYAKIIEEKTGHRCCYENDSKRRSLFEHTMSNFSLDYDYISTNKVKEISKSALLLNEKFINKIKSSKSHLINVSKFSIDDACLINKDLIKSFQFKNTDFLINHDILELILNSNSIGLYINSFDIINNNLDIDFIFRATKRLNKYIKRPVLFLFLPKNEDVKINSYIDFRKINIDNPIEEFYLLKRCKHKIILNTKNSYSQGFWAAILSHRDYNYCCFDKNLKIKKALRNWLAV